MFLAASPVFVILFDLETVVDLVVFMIVNFNIKRLLIKLQCYNGDITFSIYGDYNFSVHSLKNTLFIACILLSSLTPWHEKKFILTVR